MSTTDICRSLIDYNDTLNRRLWQSIFTLSDEQFTAPFDYSHGSVCDQVVHLAGVEGRWLRGLKGDPGARSFNPRPTGFPTRQAAFDLWDPIARDLQSFVHQLDQAGLDAHPPGLNEPTWQVILQIVNHGTDHRAQTLRLLHDLGAPTFNQDLIMYFWDQKRASVGSEPGADQPLPP